MPMNQKIREKRKELGLTQEQVAEYLGVSTPAVSKWESGASYPDIMLLPALARVLKTEPNVLLCFQEEPSEQEVHKFCSTISEILKKEGKEKGLKETVDFMEQKIREYPYCASLLHTFALTLEGTLTLSTLSAEERLPYEEKILSWHRKVLEGKDEKLKISSAFMLSSRYMMQEEYDKAQEMIDLLPEYNMTDKKVVQADLYLYKKEQLPEAEKILQKKLFSTVMDLNGILMRLVKVTLADGNPEKASRIAEITGQAITTLGYSDYFKFILPLDIALAKKEEEKSIRLIEALLSSAFHLWELNDCPLYDQIFASFAKDSSASNFPAYILPPLLAALEKSPEYEFLRQNPSFLALIEKYRRRL